MSALIGSGSDLNGENVEMESAAINLVVDRGRPRSLPHEWQPTPVEQVVHTDANNVDPIGERCAGSGFSGKAADSAGGVVCR